MKGRYRDQDDRWRPVVPVRFVRGCRRGHIGDIDWYVFVHRGTGPCRRPLWMDERGTSGDLAEVWVRCECGQERRVSEAAPANTRALGPCDGKRLWLGPYTAEACVESNRMLVRTASNSYFPQTMSVISLPDRNERVARAVAQVWEDFLETVGTLEQLREERQRRRRVREVLEGLSDDEVL
jgi:hypothetical protein